MSCSLLTKLQLEEGLDIETLAAVLLKMAQGERPIIIPQPQDTFIERNRSRACKVGDMDIYRIEIGRDDGLEARNIVGTLANQGYIRSRDIGNIKLFASHSTIELAKGIPGYILYNLNKTSIFNKPMKMQFVGKARGQQKFLTVNKISRKPY
jgi:ATP-dependent RNA helicase DeaD